MQKAITHMALQEIKKLFKKSNDLWYYEQQDLGFNYRMNELQAALGLSQMSKIDYFLKRRHEIAKIYDESLIDCPLICPKNSKNVFSAFHLYIIRIINSKSKNIHSVVFKKLRENGINVNLHYIPIYRHPYYKKFKFRKRLSKCGNIL